MGAQRVVEAVVDVDYGQFYVLRAGCGWASDRVPSQGYEEHLWSDRCFVYVGTARQYGATPVRVEVLDVAPISEPSVDWQHVAEAALDPGGDLELYSWGADAPAVRVPVDAGPLRLQVCWRGLAADPADGSGDGTSDDANEDGGDDEEMLVRVWPAAPAPPGVTRWWPGWLLPEPTEVAPDGRRQVEGLEPVVERLSHLTVVARLAHPYPLMPGGGEHSSVVSVLTDPDDGSWWVDGYDVRRTLREVSERDARRLLTSNGPAPA